MKINVDRSSAGFAAEKYEKQSKTPQVSKPEVSAAFDTKDEVELTSKKAAILDDVRESNVGSSSSVSFDASQIPMLKQRLQFFTDYALSNPTEALSAQANLNSETVAKLVG